MPIIDIQRRLHEAGRIRIGAQVPTSNGKMRPAKLDTFRFTSADGRALSAIANEYGGAVEGWEGAPAGEQWQVITTSAEIAVLVPPEAMSYSQFYELWSGGGCQRRCDGQWEQISDSKCPCDPEERQCKPHTRLSVMLAALPGTGLWRLDTQGWYAAVELGGALELSSLVSSASGRSILPGRLRLDQREVKRPNQPTRKFAVPVLDLDVDMVALASGEAPAIGSGSRPSLTPVPADSEPVPPLAAQLAAVNEPKATTTRSNAAEPIRRTGLAPKGAQSVIDATAEDGPAPVHTEDAANLPGATDRISRLNRLLEILDSMNGEKSACSAQIKELFGPPSRMTVAQIDDATRIASTWGAE